MIKNLILYSPGLFLCLWSELIDSDLLQREDSMINIHDILNMLKCTQVLLGNASELESHRQGDASIGQEHWSTAAVSEEQ